MAKTDRRPQKLTKRTVDAAKPASKRYTIWDTEIKRFGLRVEPTGVKTFIYWYRAGRGRSAAQKFLKLGSGNEAPESMRAIAARHRAAVSRGEDPASARIASDREQTLQQLAEAFLSDYAPVKVKPGVVKLYRWTFDKYVLPELGKKKISSLRESDFSDLHWSMRKTPYQANRVLTACGSLFTWVREKRKIMPADWNLIAGIERYAEESRERYLTTEELARIGEAIRLGETTGFHRKKRSDKNAPKVDVSDRLSPYAAAALRLLLLTGARRGEILNLKWEHVDFQRGLLLLPDSKSGKKTIVLNPPALSILASLPRVDGNPYVIAGAIAGEQLKDLKRPWSAVCAHAGLSKVRLHDLRHTFASYGASASLGLPIIGKLLGHSQSETTQRYAHLADDPIRRASEMISSAIAASMGDAAAVRNAEVISHSRSSPRK